MIRAGIVGAAGYVGSNLVRLVSEHPQLVLDFVGSSTHSGKRVSDVYAFVQNTELSFSRFDPLDPPNVDVLFMAMPHATSHVWMHHIMEKTDSAVFDLSADFRLNSSDSFEQYYSVPHENPELLDQFSFGIPELFRSDIQAKPHCALAGCFATAMILGLYPLRDQSFIDTIVIDGKTGMSGAGKKVVPTSLYCEVNEAV
ncbi:MAG: N-acetyl-gamma-glutamyl-phosphate reductase, partial [Candidatus Marinamargulisbacteria bacterium]|nr:N-acetyl-gamma-glutamyl-phosphate reductase [Candidatus Marinamargulisbacteria bacterium]